jgi:hypothetical protein
LRFFDRHLGRTFGRALLGIAPLALLLFLELGRLQRRELIVAPRLVRAQLALAVVDERRRGGARRRLSRRRRRGRWHGRRHGRGRRRRPAWPPP